MSLQVIGNSEDDRKKLIGEFVRSLGKYMKEKYWRGGKPTPQGRRATDAECLLIIEEVAERLGFRVRVYNGSLEVSRPHELYSLCLSLTKELATAIRQDLLHAGLMEPGQEVKDEMVLLYALVTRSPEWEKIQSNSKGRISKNQQAWIAFWESADPVTFEVINPLKVLEESSVFDGRGSAKGRCLGDLEKLGLVEKRGVLRSTKETIYVLKLPQSNWWVSSIVQKGE